MKQTKNYYLLTNVFLFHAIIDEAQSRVFYVTHALPFKIWTCSFLMLFDHMLFEKIHLIFSYVLRGDFTDQTQRYKLHSL